MSKVILLESRGEWIKVQQIPKVMLILTHSHMDIIHSHALDLRFI